MLWGPRQNKNCWIGVNTDALIAYCLHLNRMCGASARPTRNGGDR